MYISFIFSSYSSYLKIFRLNSLMAVKHLWHTQARFDVPPHSFLRMLFTFHFKFNLLSILQLTKSTNCNVIFFIFSKCIFQDRSTKEKIDWIALKMAFFILMLMWILILHFLFSIVCHSRFGRPSRPRFDFVVKNSPTSMHQSGSHFGNLLAQLHVAQSGSCFGNPLIQ